MAGHASWVLRIGFILLGLAPLVRLAAGGEPIPTPEEVERMLEAQPISRETWPVWRQRVIAWRHDREDRTKAFYEAIFAFMLKEAQGGTLPPMFAKDPIAWYVYGSALMRDQGQELNVRIKGAEAAFRRCIELDPRFAGGHSGLAYSLILQALGVGGERPHATEVESKLGEATKEIDEYVRLDPEARPSVERGMVATCRREYAQAERLLRQGLVDYPNREAIAVFCAKAVVCQDRRAGSYADAVRPLCERFPKSGELRAVYAAALALDERFRAAVSALDEAEALGTDPAKAIGAEVVRLIRGEGEPSLLERFLWTMAYFGAAYAVVMVLMAVAGLLLAAMTHARRPAREPESALRHTGAGAAVVLERRESLLGRLYMLALMLGLLLFYAAIPFLVAGLLAATGGVLYAILSLPRIPVRLLVGVLVVGLAMAWAVLKSIFAKAESGSFGLLKSAADCPRLHALVQEVAERVETRPVDEVYLAPGSAIGVHQEGRGPFGLFGVKRRVLTLGIPTLHYLTLGELKAILAHEYAHFSHRDTFHSRFIYQVMLSIDQALTGMGSAGGKLNYINPFFWFLVLYYKCYCLLASGFSRSREFLADRMAASLYGKQAFASGLRKVGIEGTLFEAVAYDNIAALLAEGKAFTNVYAALRDFRDNQLAPEERRKLEKSCLDQKASVFATHPTFRERCDAIAGFPPGPQADEQPAMTLFEDPEAIEKELTEYLTGSMLAFQRAQAAAAQGQS